MPSVLISEVNAAWRVTGTYCYEINPLQILLLHLFGVLYDLGRDEKLGAGR
jgi:hypothetical protein